MEVWGSQVVKGLNGKQKNFGDASFAELEAGGAE